MKVSKAVFVSSVSRLEHLPKTQKPEYAFIGRSNVGKSSLVNALTGMKGLAKTSSKPGKTITINHFLINDQWFLVDLPGYGYAKRSITDRQKWQLLMHQYLARRQNLRYAFILVDSRIPPQQNDLDMINRMGKAGIPFVMLFTKSDKLSANELNANLANYRKTLSKWWEVLPTMIVTSAEKKTGIQEVLSFIEADCQSAAGSDASSSSTSG